MPPKSNGLSQSPNSQKSQQLESKSQILELLEGLGIKTPGLKHQAHGLTVNEMEDLRISQANGEKPEKMDANMDSNFQINVHEKGMYHVLVEQERWSEKGRIKLSKPRLIKLSVKDFGPMSQTTVEAGSKKRPMNAFGAYDMVKVIHDPTLKAGKSSKTETPVDTMSLDELRAKFQEISGEVASEDFTKEDLVDFINQGMKAKELTPDEIEEINKA